MDDNRMDGVPHGGPAGYHAGCRCEACTASKTTRSWVDRNVKRWGGSLIKDPQAFCHNLPQWDGCREITAELVYEKYLELEYKLKRAVLSAARAEEKYSPELAKTIRP